MSFKSSILELIETTVLSMALILVLYNLVASVEIVSGSSMEPTFHDNERILVDKVTKYIKPLQRGEVVVFYPPGDNRHLIKRILAVPGDVFKIVNCQVFLSKDGNRFELVEGYIYDGACTRGGQGISEGKSTKLGPDEYALLGDNRENSMDSRTFGFVKRKDIVGRVVFVFWPLTSLGFIK